jgi:hypothetical protein
MKTDDLIAVLATGVAPIERRDIGKRFGAALMLGGAMSILLTAWVYGIRPDFGQAVGTLIFWAKEAFALTLGSAALWLTMRLSRPGRAMGWAPVAVAAPLVVVLAATIAILGAAAPQQRVALLVVNHWWLCALNVAWLSVPSFLLVLAEMRALAPTRLRLAGMSAGVLAGAIGCLAFSLRCDRVGVPSWSEWYVLGIFIPAALGALIGPRVLRW